MCLAQGHNAVRLEPAASRSRIKHSTTEPLRSRKGAGTFSKDYTTNLDLQCSAFSRSFKIEKLKALLFPGPEGGGGYK